MIRTDLIAWLAGAGLVLAACGEPAPQGDGADDAAPEADAATEAAPADAGAAVAPTQAAAPDAPDSAEPEPAAAYPPHEETDPDITEADFAYRIRSLADDAFKGRAPATPEGEAAAEWIATELERAGAAPAGTDGWYQEVPLIEATLDEAASRFDIAIDGEPMGLELGADAVYWTQNPEARVTVEASDLVFVGYGVVAPEYGWDDYAGVDVEGKTVVMLVNDPGFANPEGEAFNGEAMTYYGRWTYKYEEAARQGAAGAIIVHQTEPASYPWEVVYSSWTGAQFTLQREGELALVPVQSWIQLDAARRLFAAVGEDFDALAEAAASSDFEPVALSGATLSADLRTDLRTLTSNNVIGRIEGASRPDEHVLFMAHWDHLGQRLNFSGEDQTYNGAVDNATGTAAVLEIAERFATAETPPERSVLVVFVTAEEQGLLGSQWYAENPTVPLDQIVGGFNFDGMLPAGPTEDMVVIGYGASELEDLLSEEAEARGRYISPDPNPEAGYFYRSDHVTLARKGVPMLYSDSGSVHVERGREYVAQIEAAYRLEAYHKPADEYDPAWDLSGMARDTQLMYAVGRRLTDSGRWPNWYEGNEFRSLRDEMMGESR